MKTRIALLTAFLGLGWSLPALADTFVTVEKPSFAGIEARQVYGLVTYDMTFLNNPKNSAENFLKSISEAKFRKQSGNYIVTIEATLDGKRIVSEPIISARWAKDKFLFITTSETSTLEAKRDGVLLENIVVDNETNKLGLSVRAYFSSELNIDLSLFKEISNLSNTASVASLVPGLAAVASVYNGFAPLLEKLLSRYQSSDIVESKTGAFTLLDEGFGNVLNYKDGRISINIYLKTVQSQLKSSIAMGKFNNPDQDLAVATVKAGVGAARARVLDIILEDDTPAGARAKGFLKAILDGTPFGQGPGAEPVRVLCDALKTRFNALVTSRDASLLYWAFLKQHRGEIQKYPDGVRCADSSLTANLQRVGLMLDPAEWPQP
jgi:hypothetical protein